MPQSKIDSKCFNLTKKVDHFLSLSNVGRTDLTPPGFWKELASDEEAVSRSVDLPPMFIKKDAPRPVLLSLGLYSLSNFWPAFLLWAKTAEPSKVQADTTIKNF